MSNRTRNRSNNRSSYGLGRFIIDIILICLTGGLWLIWMVFKALRS